MAVLNSLLTLYSALDQAVLRSGHYPEVPEAVEKYLPGSTGEHAGWSVELADFLSRLPGAQPPPTVREALDDITNSPPPSASVTGRLVYVIGALLNLPPDRLSEDIPTDLYASVLDFARPLANGGSGVELQSLLANDFPSGSAWSSLAEKAYARELMSLDVSRWRPCESKLIPHGDGPVCVKLLARYTDDELTIDQVKNVLEPTNWPDLSEFFCDVSYSGGVGANGWQPALEIVSSNCPDQALRTALTFYKYEVADQIAGVEYDLDPHPPAGREGDGIVKVDHGSIQVRSLEPAGVEVHASKVVYIDGLSPVAQNIYTCVMGYGSLSQEMILGGARNPPPHPDPFRPSPNPDGSHQSDPPQSDPDGGSDAKPPSAPAPSADPVEAAIDMVTDCAKELTDRASKVAGKWAAGTLTNADVIEYSSYVGARVASDPWRFLALFTGQSGSGRRKDARS
jgi:hypothetical protein